MLEEQINLDDLVTVISVYLSSDDNEWLHIEFANLLLQYPKLLPVCSTFPIDQVATTIDQFFDEVRHWNSAKAILVEKLIFDLPYEEYEALTLNNLLMAGLTIKLAIYALESTKYSHDDFRQRFECPLKSIFSLNEQLRSFADQKGGDSGDNICSGGKESDINQKIKVNPKSVKTTNSKTNSRKR